MNNLEELLYQLIKNWESETVEFKQADNTYKSDKIGQYCSALSNDEILSESACGW